MLTGESNSWALGTPDGEVIQGASQGQNAWATNLTGSYFVPESSVVVSPFFDFGASSNLSLSVDIWYETGIFDGVVLEASTDFGNSWQTVGNSVPGFYNGSIQIVQDGEFVDIPAWAGSGGGYLTKKISLNQYIGQALVQFRFRLISQQVPDKFTVPDGFAFDNIVIDGSSDGGGAFEDFYFASGERVPVTIPNNQIGILIQEEASLEEVEKLLSSLGLGVPKLVEESDGMYLVPTNGPQTRTELGQLSTTIINEGGNLIRYAGLVTYPQGATVPLLTTNKIILKFSENASPAFIDEFLSSDSIEVVEKNPFVDDQYVVQIVGPTYNTLATANQLETLPEFEFAHPNFVRVLDLRLIPGDPLFANQWHHQNAGQTTGGVAGTIDADIDTDLAWDITLGNPNTIIAIVDNGFDMTHPDLTPNIWTNPGEVPSNGIDDDGNGFVDDINGWDFNGNDNNPSPGDGPFPWHGTAVAGVAAASDNTIGVTGSCPDCQIMTVRQGSTVNGDALAIQYAQREGAQVISCSWGYPVGTPTTTNVVNAINAAAGAGSIIFFAMNNPNLNDCGAIPDISSLPSVVAVSRSDNQDRFNSSGFGNCMDLLAPGVNIVTTDIQGTAGVNTSGTESCGVSVNNDYTACIIGTSYSTPLTAGVAGLMLSANPSLNRQQIQNLLQDAADKVEDSQGSYSTQTGFSTPPSGIATHGWGRVNAFEAVRIAAPVEDGGLGGVDIFLRDNRLDWGNTEQPSNTLFEPTRGFIGHWRSLDIKIDAPDPGYQTPPTNNASFESLVDETPILGANNRVYVRVRNRGPVTANEVTVKLVWTHFGTAFPAIPSNFWTSIDDPAFPTGPDTDLNIFHTVGVETINNLAYSGGSVATTGTDAAQIARFDNFQGPAAAGVVHFCLVAVVDSDQDPVPDFSAVSANLDNITPISNNVTHRNVILENTRSERYANQFVVRNPYEEAATYQIEATSPQQLSVSFQGLDESNQISLPPFGFQVITANVDFPEGGKEAEVTITQRRLNDDTVSPGGIAYRFGNPLSASPDSLITSVIDCPGSIPEGCAFPVKISVDMRPSLVPNSLLGSFTAKLTWNPTLLSLVEPITYLSDFQGVTNLDAAAGTLIFNGTNTTGVGGVADIAEVNFAPAGAVGTTGTVAVSFSALAAANTFANLLADGAVSSECPFTIVPGDLLGDVNGDDLVNSTDALIVLSFDVGLSVPEAI